jgi:predicted transcriptional regulator
MGRDLTAWHELVGVLAQGERSVDDIAAEFGQSVANTSHHLRALARAGLVTIRREGTRIYYVLSSERVADMWSASATSPPSTWRAFSGWPRPISASATGSR